jgi:hypothetical protein
MAAESIKNGVSGLKKSKRTYEDSSAVRIGRIVDRCNQITSLLRRNEAENSIPGEGVVPLSHFPFSAVPVLVPELADNTPAGAGAGGGRGQGGGGGVESAELRVCSAECDRLEQQLVEELQKRRRLLLRDGVISLVEADRASFSGVLYSGPYCPPVIFGAGSNHQALVKIERIFLAQHAGEQIFSQERRQYRYATTQEASNGLGGEGEADDARQYEYGEV